MYEGGKRGKKPENSKLVHVWWGVFVFINRNSQNIFLFPSDCSSGTEHQELWEADQGPADRPGHHTLHQ